MASLTRTEQAVEYFLQGYSCSQAVCAAFAPSLGLDRDAALKISGPFGGGLARTGSVCGALTGAMMVVGLAHGRVRADDLATRDRSYALVQEFMRRFKGRNSGALDCRDLLGCDLGTPEGREQAKAMDFHHKVCPKYIRDAGEILETILRE
ncbi:MAG: C-GCAxxG-C-C family protein [Candidatus Edwardsbacteria bacterium]|nr:C-GCAxxG-C-C family protein [Candidatus Edwardsbacteria bacterium]